MELALMIEGQEGVSWEQWVALARTCEAHGIGTLFRSDHYLDDSCPERGALDALGTLCALAAVTSRVRLGTLVCPATFRHPSTTAKLVTTADHVSGGRIELGLGAGWNEREHAAYGFAFPPLRTRMDVLEEQLQIVLGNWSDGLFSFTGTHYVLDELDAQPKPVQRAGYGGGPPLIMGGQAGRRSARMAVAYADEYNTGYVTAAAAERRKARIDAACKRAGRPPMPFSVMTTVVVGADEREVAVRAAQLEEREGLEGGTLLHEPPEGWVVGTVDTVADQLRAFAVAGVSRIMCQHLLHDDLEAVALIGDRLAPAVA